MKKRHILALMIALLCILVPLVNALTQSSYDTYKKILHHDKFEKKFFEQVDFILDKKDILALSRDQVGKVKALKEEVAGELLETDGSENALSFDVAQGLWGSDVDSGAVAEMLGQKHNIELKKNKILEKGYKQLKDILTDKQEDDLKKMLPK